MPEAWIIDALRSPRGRGKKDKGALSQIHPQRIMAPVLQGLEKRVGFDPGWVADVVLGGGSGKTGSVWPSACGTPAKLKTNASNQAQQPARGTRAILSKHKFIQRRVV